MSLMVSCGVMCVEHRITQEMQTTTGRSERQGAEGTDDTARDGDDQGRHLPCDTELLLEERRAHLME